VVLFIQNADRWVACDVEQTGGSNGTKTTAPSFTYDVTPRWGDRTVVPAMSPVWQRSNGKVVAATHGLAYRGSDGNLVLWQVDEVRDTTGCS